MLEQLRALSDNYSNIKKRLPNILNGKISTKAKVERLEQLLGASFKQLKQLMETPAFFDELFKSPFQIKKYKNEKPYPSAKGCEFDHWDSTSPIIPLITLYFFYQDMIKFPNQVYKMKDLTEDKYNPFLTLINSWWSSLANSFPFNGSWPKSDNEKFFSSWDLQVDLRRDDKVRELHQLCEQMQACQQNCTAILYIVDGVFAETLFLFKRSGSSTIHALLSSSRHEHEAIKNLIKKFRIAPKHCEAIHIEHDNNCTVDAMLNIKIINQLAKKYGSVFRVLNLLHQDQLELLPFRTTASDLGMPKHPKLNEVNIHRIIANASRFFKDCKGWQLFLKNKKIDSDLLIRETHELPTTVKTKENKLSKRPLKKLNKESVSPAFLLQCLTTPNPAYILLAISLAILLIGAAISNPVTMIIGGVGCVLGLSIELSRRCGFFKTAQPSDSQKQSMTTSSVVYS